MTLQELAKKAGIPQAEVELVQKIIEEEIINNAPVERTPETQEIVTAFWRKLADAGVFSRNHENYE